MNAFASNFYKYLKTIFLLLFSALGLLISAPLTKTVFAAPPQTTLDSTPIDFSTDATPTFTFSSDDPSATFECMTEATSYAPCTSPYTSPVLAVGTHTFTVRAINAGLEADASPAYYIWSIVAFGGGSGMTIDPYEIDNCSEWLAMRENLTASYELSGNVDCDGYTYTPIGNSTTPFEGSLDGNGYTVKNVEYSGSANAGIFGYAESSILFSSIVIKDLKIENCHIEGTTKVGGLVGYIAYAQLTNIRVSNCVVNSSSNYTGGIIGQMSAGYITTSSYQGTVASTGDRVGGIAGYLIGPSQVTNSFSVVDIGGNDYVGGIAGYIGSGAGAAAYTSYSIATFTTSTGTRSGTVAHLASGSTDNYTFSVNNLSGSMSNGDAYKDNVTEPPLDNWEFGYTHPWHQDHLYPQLFALDDEDGDSSLDSDEAAAPNSGDANGDGTVDNHQPSVNSGLNWVSNNYLSIASSSCTEISNVQVAAESTSGPSVDSINSYPAGQFSFIAKGCPVGGVAQFSLYFYGDYDISRVSLRKYNSALQQYISIPGVSFTALTIGGQKVLKATYSITDGSSLDDGGAIDGVITDPVGLALGAVTVPNTGLPVAHKNYPWLVGFVFSALAICVGSLRKPRGDS